LPRTGRQAHLDPVLGGDLARAADVACDRYLHLTRDLEVLTRANERAIHVGIDEWFKPDVVPR
jgi:hypothetical protein